MKSYLETLAQESKVYKLTESFAEKNGFYKTDISEKANRFVTSWRNNAGQNLYYELMPFTGPDPLSAEYITLRSLYKLTEFVFPRELNQDGLYIRHVTLDPETDRSFYFKYRNANNQYPAGLYTALKKHPDLKTVFSSLMKTNFPDVFDFLRICLGFYREYDSGEIK